MDHNSVYPSVLYNDEDDSTIYTPSESVATYFPNDYDWPADSKSSSTLVPWPGSTFIIRSISSGDVITLLDGQIVLKQPGGSGCAEWTCVKSKGWLGFRNVVSGKFLGHDKQGMLCCEAGRHLLWEFFDVRPGPDGGSVLMMAHYERLWHVGTKKE